MRLNILRPQSVVPPILPLILQAEIQTVQQPAQAAVVVGQQAVGAAGHEVVGRFVAVVAEFGQHVRPAGHVIQQAVVAAVVQAAPAAERQPGEAQPGIAIARPGAFRLIEPRLIFPLAIPCQPVGDLRLAFETETGVGAIAVIVGIAAEVMHSVQLAVQIQFIAVFVDDFCPGGGRRHQDDQRHQ